MFAFSKYLEVVLGFQTLNLHELKHVCEITQTGIRIDLGGTVIIDKPFDGTYAINVTLCNGFVIPRPIINMKSCYMLHDSLCIKGRLLKAEFPMNVRTHGEHVTSFFADGVLHIALPDKNESLEIAEALGIVNDMVMKQSLNAAISSFVKAHLPNLSLQSASDMVLSKTAFVFKRREATTKFTDCIDIRRCYTNALFKVDSPWAHFSCFDDIKEATLKDVLTKNGRFFVKTTNYFPLKGDSWYYHTILRYAHSQGIEFQVIMGQVSGVMYPSNLFESVVDKVKEILPSDHAKTVINRFIGMLKTKPVKERSACFVTSDGNEAHAYLKSSLNSYQEKVSNKYFCYSSQVQTHTRPSSRHMYDQLIERSWVLVHELWLELKKHGADLLWIKTDAVTVQYETQKAMNSFTVDETKYRREMVNELSVSNADETCPVPDLPDPVQFTEIEHSWKWDGKPLCFVGRAGTSKSTKMREILDTSPGAVIISPTNRAASSFSQGITVHKFFGIKDINCTTVKNKKIQQLSKTKLLLVDEVFMCSSWMLQAIHQLHQLGTTVVCAGDPFQLPAVSGGALTPQNATLCACVGGRFMNLSKNMRSAVDIAKQLSVSVENQEVHVPGIVEFKEADFSIKCHLTFTNACAFQINDQVLKHEIRRHRTVLWFFEDRWCISRGIHGLPDGCIAFTRNSPVTIREMCMYGTRNERVMIRSFTMTHVNINGVQFKICSDMFFLLRLSYAMTIHKSQGSTINERHQIHEYHKIKRNKLGSKLLYVALTRSTQMHFLSICKDCKCEQQTCKQMSQRDLFS